MPGPSVAEAGPFRLRAARRVARRDPGAHRAAVWGCAVLPRGRGRSARGGRGPGPCRRHRAGAFPVPVPRGNGPAPGDLTRLSAPGRRARAPGRPGQALHPFRRNARRGHDDRARHGVLRGRGSPRGRQAPPRAQAIRAIALELERIASHVGDLGALAGDVGFLPTASWCGRIRGDVLNMTALICGSRFGRGLVRPGGVGFDLDEALAGELAARLQSCARDAAGACELLWKTPSVLARFEGTGTLSQRDGAGIGLTGPGRARVRNRPGRAARSSFRIWRFSHVPVSTWRTGDVFARAYVRGLEVQRSFAFIQDQLGASRGGHPGAASGPPRAAFAVRLVEGGAGRSATRADGPPTGGLRATRSWTLRSATGSGSPWPCAASRSPISRCATRASTCPTAGTTCEDVKGCCGSFGERFRQGHRTTRFPRGEPPALPARFRGLPVIDHSL